MSNLLFTPASLSQQETASGGVKTPVVVNAPVVLNLNLGFGIVIGSNNVIKFDQGIKNQ
jgi:hypothetical protein